MSRVIGCVEEEHQKFYSSQIPNFKMKKMKNSKRKLQARSNEPRRRASVGSIYKTHDGDPPQELIFK